MVIIVVKVIDGLVRGGAVANNGKMALHRRQNVSPT